MEYVVSAKEMKAVDLQTSDFYGISSEVLMERAALAVVERLQELYGDELIHKSICILAGNGGNGGDGVTIARILHLRGIEVCLVLMRDKEECGDLTRKELDIAERYHVPMVNNLPAQAYDCYVDCLLGIGVSRNLSEKYASVIRAVNARSGKKIAVDIPSGIHTDTGKVLGDAFLADETVTFGFLKRGLLLYPGAEYAGKITVAEIGITKESFLGVYPSTYRLTDSDLIDGWKPRDNAGNKGSYGKVLVIAGSEGMAGAAIFAAKSVLRVGAGMVKILSDRSNREILQCTIPEAIIAVYDNTQGENKLVEISQRIGQELQWADTCIIGPGIGKSSCARALLEGTISYMENPTIEPKKCKTFVIDADAINLLAENPDLFLRLQSCEDSSLIFTPHLMELSRLMRVPLCELQIDLIENVLHFAQEKKGIFVCKDARTVVCYNQNVWINTTGNSALATAGSGDCLTGMIGGLAAQGYDAIHAANFGVFLHGLCGEDAGRRLSQASTVTSDVIDSIPYIMKERTGNVG